MCEWSHHRVEIVHFHVTSLGNCEVPGFIKLMGSQLMSLCIYISSIRMVTQRVNLEVAYGNFFFFLV